MSVETDIFGAPVGQTSERIEYGERYIRDCVFGKKGHVGRSNGSDPHDGAYYAGGPKTFELVKRTVVTTVGSWEAVTT